MCSALSHIMSMLHQLLLAGGNFYLFQATRQGSMHVHKGQQQKQVTSGMENGIHSGFQLGMKKFFSGNLSKALTFLLQLKLTIVLASKFRMKKN